MSKKATIFIVEDENTTLLFLCEILSKHYEVIQQTTVAESIKVINEHSHIDLFLVDLSLPDGTGYSVCQEIRLKEHYQNTPIVILTSSEGDEEQVLAYNLLVDAYITKPISARVLESLVRNKLSRSTSQQGKSLFLDGENLKFYPMKHQIVVNNTTIDLTPIEVKLLSVFSENKDNVLDRSSILDHVWGDNVAITDRVIDQHISALRKKIKHTNVAIETVYGVGYRFKVG